MLWGKGRDHIDVHQKLQFWVTSGGACSLASTSRRKRVGVALRSTLVGSLGLLIDAGVGFPEANTGLDEEKHEGVSNKRGAAALAFDFD